MSTDSSENPYSPPLTEIDPPRPIRSVVRTILSGLIAIVIATVLSRGGLLIPAVLGVGSWWLYKFWPRKSAPEDATVMAFLERLENAQPSPGASQSTNEANSTDQPLDALRDLRL
jgi:hypothetical protein